MLHTGEPPRDMLDNFWKWLGYFLLISVVVFVGWKEPLRYRFMSKQEIEAYEHPAIATPTPRPLAKAPPPRTPAPNWMFDPDRRTKLDEGPYNRIESTRRYYPYYTPSPYR